MDFAFTPAMAFLGNPGLEYQKTRHNVGWMFADFLEAKFPEIESRQRKFKGEYAKRRHIQGTVHLLRPLSFYNKSGPAVQEMLNYFNIAPEGLLVVHDNLEHPFGTVVLQWAGGLAGNNGLRSIKQQLGTEKFFRLSIGIGRPVHGSPDDWVLGRFSKEEEAELPLLFDGALRLLAQANPESVVRLKAGTKEKFSLS